MTPTINGLIRAPATAQTVALRPFDSAHLSIPYTNAAQIIIVKINYIL